MEPQSRQSSTPEYEGHTGVRVSQSAFTYSHRGWTRLVANKEKTECLTFEIWPVCLSLGQLQVRTWECKLSKNKNKKKLNSGPPLLGMQPSTQLCLYIHTECTHVYMRVWIYKIHRNCMEDTRMWAVKKQRKPALWDSRCADNPCPLIHNSKQKDNRHHMCCSNCPLHICYDRSHFLAS